MNPITFLTNDIMLPFLSFSYHNIYPNFGFGIILLTVIIKVILYPLTKQQFESMKRMQEMMPTFKTLREKHKDNPKKLQEETMKIYKQHNINPLGGCLPLIIQMPFLIGLFYSLNSDAFSTLISTNDVFPGLTSFWITNLSQPDPIYLLPIIIGVSTYFGQKMSTVDSNQQKILAFMPILMVGISFQMPAGVLLYWSVSQIISSTQQVLILKKGNQKNDKLNIKPV